MLNLIKGGSKINVQGIDCHIPPVGYVLNVLNNTVEYRGIYQRSQEISEQYWQRNGLPNNYKSKRDLEEEKQKNTPNYQDPELGEFRRDAWDKRLNGMWFMNNGEPTYITGMHYFYLEWIYIGGTTNNNGYPDYWDSDRKFFYFMQHVIENDKCFGMILLTRRRGGKTAKSVAFLLEATTRLMEANGGIQSKTEDDAEKIVYRKGVLKAFDKLPDFFRPKYNVNGVARGITLLEKRDKEAEQSERGLGGVIDFRASNDTAYDGDKLKRYVGDEIFKTRNSDVYNRHEIILPTLEDTNTKPYGKALYTSTVEEIEGEIANYMKFWQDSDQSDIDDITGYTKTKLYRYFIPSDESINLNIYGQCDAEENRRIILAEREQVRGDTEKFTGRVRRRPLTVEEAFRTSSSNSVYAMVRLQDRYEEISWRSNTYEQGDFIWKNGVKDSELLWVPSTKGKWKVLWDYIDKDLLERPIQSRLRPWNNHRFAIGCDPYSHSRTVDYRNSSGAFYVFKKHDSTDPINSEVFIVEYIARPATSDIFFEDLIKTCVYFGCEALIENNRNNIMDYLVYREYSNWMMQLPNRPTPGIPGSTKTHADIIAHTESYIYQHIDKVYFPRLIEDWKGFDPFNTTKFDAAMAAGYTLIADNKYNLVLMKMGNKKMYDVDLLFPKRASAV